MAEPSWQELLRLRLAERNVKDAAFAPIIEQYRKLAQQTKLLKERNASLLHAVDNVRGNQSVITLLPGKGEDNPVRAAYLVSLESQISSLRDELATVYKTQGQNVQRLLSMNETLREKEELTRIDAENLRKAREEIAVLRRKVDQHAELMSEKDHTVQILHDEISTLQLELGQIEERNQTLQKDNAKLLQRWLDAKQTEANKMNEANDFYEDMRSRHQAVLTWRDGPGQEGAKNGTSSEPDTSSQASPSMAGKDEVSDDTQSMLTKDGTPSPAAKGLDLTPNG